MTADDVRARFEAEFGAGPAAQLTRSGDGYLFTATQWRWEGFKAAYRAAHADRDAEVRELVEAATEIADNTENWNRAVIKIIGRQPNTGIGTERLRAALAKFTQEKP